MSRREVMSHAAASTGQSPRDRAICAWPWSRRAGVAGMGGFPERGCSVPPTGWKGSNVGVGTPAGVTGTTRKLLLLDLIRPALHCEGASGDGHWRPPSARPPKM